MLVPLDSSVFTMRTDQAKVATLSAIGSKIENLITKQIKTWSLDEYPEPIVPTVKCSPAYYFILPIIPIILLYPFFWIVIRDWPLLVFIKWYTGTMTLFY